MILTKNACLEVELAATTEVGEHFVKATYSLEGDGPRVLTCFEVLSAVKVSIQVAHIPNTQANYSTPSFWE